MNTCETCVFWIMGSNRIGRTQGGMALRECHSNPPVVLIDREGNYKSLFPMVRADDCCGIHEQA